MKSLELRRLGLGGPFGLTVRVSGVRTVDLGENVGAPPKILRGSVPWTHHALTFILFGQRAIQRGFVKPKVKFRI